MTQHEPLPRTTPSQPYHRIARAIPHRGYWWRPLVTTAVAAFVWIAMNLQVMVPLMILGELWPAASTSPSLMDPLNPADQVLGLGMLALLVPAVLVGSLAGYGRAGIVLSVMGRFRWGLLGRAALVVVPVYVLLNMVLNLILEREAIVIPHLGPAVILAWLVALLLAPLQCAGEEVAFRALPMQVLGTWLRWPLLGILVPVPLFVLGHGYNWVGQIDIALFAIVMGLLAWKTGGLEIPILLHTANNWTLFAISPLIPGFTEQGEVGFLGLALALVPMLLLSAGIWWWYSKRAGLELWEPQRGRGQTLSSASASSTSSASPSAPVAVSAPSAESTSRPLSV
ncbi:lysostaphin resistance A-like protein [Brachybacterium sp. 107]|uniref:lysostaphin resistance A-like protein n=1 Tax=Brachybacterium sp. 107 TaxID=3457736 RepID=UPI0040340926